MTMAYDHEPDADEAAYSGDCICKQYDGRGVYIEDGQKKYCDCEKGVREYLKDREFCRKKGEK